MELSKNQLKVTVDWAAETRLLTVNIESFGRSKMNTVIDVTDIRETQCHMCFDGSINTVISRSSLLSYLPLDVLQSLVWMEIKMELQTLQLPLNQKQVGLITDALLTGLYSKQPPESETIEVLW